MAKYLFINASANSQGTTAQFGNETLDGLDYEQINLVDFRINFFGQNIQGDQYDEVFNKVLRADAVLLGSPVYTNWMSAAARLFFERLETHEKAKELSGRGIAFFIQGYDANSLLVESCTASVKNAVEPQGMRFLGTATNLVELAELRESIESFELVAQK